MCGIVGYIGKKPCIDFLYSGLESLSYRGYDSAGIAVNDSNAIQLIKSAGKLARLKPLLQSLPTHATVGMGHTRWATHGPPSTENAHPHRLHNLALIHNGIIDNYQELKIELLEKGMKFVSDTDSEIILHLLKEELQIVGSSNVLLAIHNLVGRLQGAYAIAIMTAEEPETIYVVKHGSPIAIGHGKKENMFASDAMPILKHTKKVSFLEDGEIAKITPANIEFCNFLGQPIAKEPVDIDWDATTAEKEGYRHYMLKEIYEQPNIIRHTIERVARLQDYTIDHKALDLDQIDWSKINRIIMVACGTAFYAAQIGAYTLEPLLKIPVTCELASEFRYRQPFLTSDTLIMPITQSGETADTLASVKHAKSQGCQIYSVCNVQMSSIPRESDATLYMKAGPEIGVASTKAFSSMVLNLYLLALALKEKLNGPLEKSIFKELQALPSKVEKALAQSQAIEDIAHEFNEIPNCLFIGRGSSFPIAFEGALKLKEISYIHAEGYAGGELKHGPIALIDRNMPVVAIVPNDRFREKMLANVEEVRAREGQILAIGPKDDTALAQMSEFLIDTPQTQSDSLQTLLSVIPLQLFSYYVAVQRGTDVDQPRNLAKSVTVE